MNDIWNVYNSKNLVRGVTRRDTYVNREKSSIANKLKNSLSFHSVDIYIDGITKDIYPQNIISQDIAIINSDNLNEKYIYSLPNEDIIQGSVINWGNNYWVVTEKDFNTEIYTKAIMIQCNYLLKWIVVEDDVPVIKEQWCFIEDGTKYMTGEYTDRDFIATRGDMRIAMTISRNRDTALFNRESRFLIDDPDAPSKISFGLTKSLRVGGVYNKQGVFKFVLSESNSTQYDNMDLGIPDYYKHFEIETSQSQSENVNSNERRVWI